MPTVDEYIESINNLPVLPEIARKIIALADSEDPDINEISELIQKDPAITVKILKLINSGYYTLRKEVISVRQAVILLGLQQVRNLVVTMVTVNHFTEKPNARIKLLDFWNHSLGVATIAQSLGERFGYRNTGDIYLCALLHDIGKIIIQSYYPLDLLRIIRVIDRESVPMFEAEKQVLGFSHADIGACLTKLWMFPLVIQDAILNHHDCSKSEDPLFCAILEFADMVTKSRLYAVYGDQHTDFVIEDHRSWQVICRELSQKGEDVDLVRLLLEMDDEIDRARDLVKQAREP